MLPRLVFRPALWPLQGPRAFKAVILLLIVGCATREPRVTARVVKQDYYRGAIESAVYPRYEVEFANAEAYAVRIARYEATWAGNQREIVPTDLMVPPGERRTTVFVVKPDGKPITPEPDEITLEWTAERAP